uniref:HEPN domain-containing protein n=1 Tax=viral metagenome TaxID=1070528 RepID=A0A6M3LNQ8_9ZZZZ
MGNMSYCRFENTYRDLKDCWDYFETGEELSESETLARKALVRLCKEIAEEAML